MLLNILKCAAAPPTVLRLINSGLREETVKEEKGLPSPRTAAMTDIQLLKDEANTEFQVSLPRMRF